MYNGIGRMIKSLPSLTSYGHCCNKARPWAARAAAPHPARTIPVVSQGRVGRSTLRPIPALIPPSSLVPTQTLSHEFHMSINSMPISLICSVYRVSGRCRSRLGVSNLIVGDIGGVYHIERRRCIIRGRREVYNSVRGINQGLQSDTAFSLSYTDVNSSCLPSLMPLAGVFERGYQPLSQSTNRASPRVVTC